MVPEWRYLRLYQAVEDEDGEAHVSEEVSDREELEQDTGCVLRDRFEIERLKTNFKIFNNIIYHQYSENIFNFNDLFILKENESSKGLIKGKIKEKRKVKTFVIKNN